jgi:hypothetical protein
MGQCQKGFLTPGPEREAQGEIVHQGIVLEAQPGDRRLGGCRGTRLGEGGEKRCALRFTEVLHDHRVIDHRRLPCWPIGEFAGKPSRG